MRVARISAIAFVLAGLSGTPSTAFVLGSGLLNGKVAPHQWRRASLPLHFVMNDRPLWMLPNLAVGSTPQAAVQTALAAWEIPPVSLRLNGTVATTDHGWDGVNLITFADTPKNRELTGNFTGITISSFIAQGGYWRFLDADVFLNPKIQFATDGRADRFDMQSTLTHELGHALGLDHSAFRAATMVHWGVPGYLARRSPEPDDLAGVRALYDIDPGPQFGTITGQVVTTAEAPVFGAHVVATDVEGIAQVGAVTDWEGNFTIPSLPAGDYRLYAEPLDGPVTIDNLSSTYKDPRHPVLRDFRTTFAGRNSTPAAITVAGGQATATDSIRVEAQPPTLNPMDVGWSLDQRTWWWDPTALVPPGTTLYLGVHGLGMDTVPASGFQFSGNDVVVTGIVQRGSNRDRSDTWTDLRLTVSPWARPGARNLYVSNGQEVVVSTAVLQIARR